MLLLSSMLHADNSIARISIFCGKGGGEEGELKSFSNEDIAPYSGRNCIYAFSAQVLSSKPISALKFGFFFSYMTARQSSNWSVASEGRNLPWLRPETPLDIDKSRRSLQKQLIEFVWTNSFRLNMCHARSLGQILASICRRFYTERGGDQKLLNVFLCGGCYMRFSLSIWLWLSTPWSP